MKVKIRKAEPKDLEEIYRLGLSEEGFAVSPRTRFYGKEYLKNWLKDSGDDILLVAKVDRVIAGFLFCTIMVGKWAMGENLVVAKGKRDRGIGTALQNECARRLKRKGIDYMGAWVRDGNQVVMKFLVKKGFKMIIENFEKFLEDEGVKPMHSEGEIFDPYKHEALMVEDTEELPENTIIEELHKGYYLNNKVLKPAGVKISKTKS